MSQYTINKLINLQMMLTVNCRHEDWYAETIDLLVTAIDEIKAYQCGGTYAGKSQKAHTNSLRSPEREVRSRTQSETRREEVSDAEYYDRGAEGALARIQREGSS